MSLIWPVGLPSCMETGWTHDPDDTSLSTAMERGPAKSRETFATPVDTLSGSILMEKVQVTILWNFYRRDAKGRSVPWEWVHPLDRTPRLYRFIEKPSTSKISRRFYRAALRLEMLPIVS